MNSRRSFTTLFNLFYIFVRIVWPPFQAYYLHADGAGLTLLVLSGLVILLNINEFQRHKKAFATPAFRCWVVLLCYSMLNSFFKGFYAQFGVFNFYKVNFFHPFLLLVIATMELYKDRERGLKAIWIALGIFFLIGLPFLGRSLSGRATVGELGNLYPLHLVSFLFVSAVMLVEGKMKSWLFAGLTFVLSFVILISGTRKAFGAEIIILLGVLLNHSKVKDVWYYFRIILLGIVMLTFIRFSLTRSTVGQRLEADFETERKVQLVGNEYVNDVLVKLLGDRAIQYERALALFNRHVLTGIGLTNFIHVVVESPVRLHSEYMVQLCENGLIGFVLMVIFYTRIWKALKKAKRRTKSRVFNMLLYGLAAVLFLNFTCWTYNLNFAMIIYAVFLIYANPKAEYRP